jgi:hypothetical protein
MVVELEAYEAAHAARVAVDRHTQSVARGSADAFGCDKDWLAGLRRHMVGALGEVAYSKAANRYWNGSVGTYKHGGDVGPVQVRTRTKPEYELLVRPGDPDDALFVLVRTIEGGPKARLEVVGSITGAEAKRVGRLATYGGRQAAYFVADSFLTPIGGN